MYLLYMSAIKKNNASYFYIVFQGLNINAFLDHNIPSASNTYHTFYVLVVLTHH